MADAQSDQKPFASTLSGDNSRTALNTSSSALINELSQKVDFLPVHDAFQASATLTTSAPQAPSESSTQADTLLINWQIAPGYYLYRHRFSFTNADTESTITARIPDGKAKQDEYFGDVEVYYNQVTIALPANAISSQSLTHVNFQGCADAGLCYPPQTLYLQRANQTITLSTKPPQNNSAAPSNATEQSFLEQDFTALLATAQLGSIMGLFLLAGLALTFTPCVLPMIPIISSIVLGQSRKPSRLRAFSLSLTYVLAMAGTYAMAGTLTGYFGASFNLQLKLQSPLVIITMAVLFVAFALAMLGLYELRLPSALQNRLQQLSQNQRGGTYAGVALIGVVSTLIVSPCVTAPLAGTLVFISSTGDPLLGGIALLSLGLGMGLPLLLIGTFGTQLLPNSGAWMNQIKVLFGILLLGLAIWMLDRVLPPVITSALWIALLSGYALHLGVLKLLRRTQVPATLPLLGLLIILYSGLLTFNATQGHFNPFEPFKSLSAAPIELEFKSADNLQALQAILREHNNGQVVMLDLYADWCVSCRILEQQVFTTPEVSSLLQQLVLVRADITSNTPEHQALLKQFGLFGPPSLLFFTAQQELRPLRVQGEIDAKALQRHLTMLPKKPVQETLTLAN